VKHSSTDQFNLSYSAVLPQTHLQKPLYT